MARRLLGIAEDANIPPAVRLTAIRDALDRAGVNERHAVELEVRLKPFEETLESATNVRIQRLPAEEDDAAPRHVIDADVVDVEDDSQPLGHHGENVVDLPTRSGREAHFRQQQRNAMLSQAELQEGRGRPETMSRGERSTPTRWER